jgi:hypothetical protein
LVELFGSHRAFSRGHHPQSERAGQWPPSGVAPNSENKVSQIIRTFTLENIPERFVAGADAVGVFETKADTLRAQANAHRELSNSLAYDNT